MSTNLASQSIQSWKLIHFILFWWIRRRQHRLEQEQADIEYEIRVLMAQPECNKTDSDKSREETLITRLLEVVQLRNEVIESLEMDRRREAEEDQVSIPLFFIAFTRESINNIFSFDAEHKRAHGNAYGPTGQEADATASHKTIEKGEEETKGIEKVGQTEESRCGQGKKPVETETQGDFIDKKTLFFLQDADESEAKLERGKEEKKKKKKFLLI